MSEHVGVPRKREFIPANLRTRVMIRDSGTCRYCGACYAATEMHLDHVLPVRYGGRATYKNLVVACANCNQRKGTKAWEPIKCGDHLKLNPRGDITVTDEELMERRDYAAKGDDSMTKVFKAKREASANRNLSTEAARRINGL